MFVKKFKNYVILVLEFVGNGNLYKFFVDNPEFFLSELKIMNLFAQICEGVHYLHKQRMIHRDIKPENILIDEHFTPKLCDFGWAIKLIKNEVRTTFCGTFDYMAPEVFESANYDSAVDIWSLGIILFELFHGYSPYKGKNAFDIFNNIKNNPLVFKEDLNAKIVDLIKKMLQIKPTKRIPIDEILIVLSNEFEVKFEPSLILDIQKTKINSVKIQNNVQSIYSTYLEKDDKNSMRQNRIACSQDKMSQNIRQKSQITIEKKASSYLPKHSLSFLPSRKFLDLESSQKKVNSTLKKSVFDNNKKPQIVSSIYAKSSYRKNDDFHRLTCSFLPSESEQVKKLEARKMSDCDFLKKTDCGLKKSLELDQFFPNKDQQSKAEQDVNEDFNPMHLDSVYYTYYNSQKKKSEKTWISKVCGMISPGERVLEQYKKTPVKIFAGEKTRTMPVIESKKARPTNYATEESKFGQSNFFNNQSRSYLKNEFEGTLHSCILMKKNSERRFATKKDFFKSKILRLTSPLKVENEKPIGRKNFPQIKIPMYQKAVIRSCFNIPSTPVNKFVAMQVFQELKKIPEKISKIKILSKIKKNQESLVCITERKKKPVLLKNELKLKEEIMKKSVFTGNEKNKTHNGTGRYSQFSKF